MATMDMKIFLTVFITVFIAEIGDKTQLATLLFAADKDVNKWIVFCAASLALMLAAGTGVLAGTMLSNYISARFLGMIAGVGFIAIGIWTLLST